MTSAVSELLCYLLGSRLCSIAKRNIELLSAVPTCGFPIFGGNLTGASRRYKRCFAKLIPFFQPVPCILAATREFASPLLNDTDLTIYHRTSIVLDDKLPPDEVDVAITGIPVDASEIHPPEHSWNVSKFNWWIWNSAMLF